MRDFRVGQGSTHSPALVLLEAGAGSARCHQTQVADERASARVDRTVELFRRYVHQNGLSVTIRHVADFSGILQVNTSHPGFLEHCYLV